MVDLGHNITYRLIFWGCRSYSMQPLMSLKKGVRVTSITSMKVELVNKSLAIFMSSFCQNFVVVWGISFIIFLIIVSQHWQQQITTRKDEMRFYLQWSQVTDEFSMINVDTQKCSQVHFGWAPVHASHTWMEEYMHDSLKGITDCWWNEKCCGSRTNFPCSGLCFWPH